MLAAYTGNSAYCFSHGLHMCQTHAGMPQVPDVSLLECMTGMPFGASFLQLPTPLFFPSPGGKASPDRGLSRALETVGWACETLRFEDPDPAATALRAALDRGPALIGPLDMGWLPCSMGKPDAARLFAARAEAFGHVQYHAARGDWQRAADLFDGMASIEAQVGPAI